MRKLLLSIACLLILSPVVFGQRALYKPQVHEIGFQAGAFNMVPALSEGYQDGLPGSATLLNGIRYKYHHSISDGFRLGVFRRTADLQFAEGLNIYDTYQSDKTDWDIQLGYERKVHKGPLQFFAGADVRYTLGQMNDTGIQGATTVEISHAYQGIGGSVLGGMSFFISKNLSATLEAEGYLTRLNYGSGTNIEVNPPLIPNQEAGFNLSLYLSLHAVNMKKRCTCPKIKRR
ncbi:MAG: hypothetical protein AAFR61_11390 [Bacteroidota bacterium]